jgi:hypothetical protein
MPVSPADAERLAAEVVGHYQEAERLMIERIARNLAKGIEGPAWAEQKLAQIQAYKRETQALLKDLEAKAKTGVETAITQAYDRGGLSAVADIAKMRAAESAASDAAEKALEGKWWPSPDNQFRWAIVRNGEVETVFATKEDAQSFAGKYMKGQKRTYVRQNFNEMTAVADAAKQAAAVSATDPLAGLRAVEALTQETLGNVTATHRGILRATQDAYRSIIAETGQQLLLGAQTRLQATQAALDRFAQRGITGFVDKAGRGWSMEAYTEMAMRTGCGRAAVQGHADRLMANGLDLVIVSDAPKECPICRGAEGQVYSLSGTSSEYPSLDDARAAGLFHCNCRHSINAYQEGVTRPMTGTEDPEGYVATQKLRYLERGVRQSKRMEAAAMSPEALAKATRRKLDYQAKIRTHVATTSAKRQPYRESLGVSKAQLARMNPKP